MDEERRASGDFLATARMDKSVLSVGTFEDDDANVYWTSRTVEERLEAMELMRMINYDYNPVTDRLQRVLEVVEF